jgi:methyltransferase (TIGR00027 family)
LASGRRADPAAPRRRLTDDGAGGDDPTTTGLIGILADAGRAGIRQVVVLASGLDTRPYRLCWPPGTTVYEIDRAQVLDFKSELLRGLGAELDANRCAVGIDLRQDWLAALRRVGFDTAQPAIWIVEQLLVGYLPPGVQNRLLRDVTAVSAAGSRFAAMWRRRGRSSTAGGGTGLTSTWPA